MTTNLSRDALRRKRHSRIRLRITGTTERPRLSVFRSAKYIYAQVIDDSSGRTLAAASSREADLGASTPVDTARSVGKALPILPGSDENANAQPTLTPPHSTGGAR